MHITMQPQEVRKALTQYLLEHRMIREDQVNLIEFKFTNMRHGKGLITEVHFLNALEQIPDEEMPEQQVDLEEAIAQSHAEEDQDEEVSSDIPAPVVPAAVGSLFSN